MIALTTICMEIDQLPEYLKLFAMPLYVVSTRMVKGDRARKIIGLYFQTIELDFLYQTVPRYNIWYQSIYM